MSKKAGSIAKLHKSVLEKEVLTSFGLQDIAHLKSEDSIKIIDATLGLGGHTLSFLKKGAQVLAIEQDPEMLKLAKIRLEARPIPDISENRGSYKLIHANFREIKRVAQNESFSQVDAILFDLGVSSPQITSRERGFSFQNDQAKLDMRIDPTTQSVKASDLLNLLRQDQLTSLFAKILKFNTSKKLSKQIVSDRLENKFQTIADIKNTVSKVIKKKKKLNILTLPLLALRIAVNSELHNLNDALEQSVDLLKDGGKLAVISFHSLEDSIVKNYFKDLEKSKRGTITPGKAIVPNKEEIASNIRSRSAKLRIFIKNES